MMDHPKGFTSPKEARQQPRPPKTADTIHAASSWAATRRLLLLGIPLFWATVYVYYSYLTVYARSLGASLSLVGIIVAIYGFTQLALRIPIGIASDRLGRRKPFLIGGGLAGALASAALLIAPEPWVLVLGRGLAGVTAACWVTLSVLLVASFRDDEVVRATGIATGLTGLGITLASAAGGQLAEAAGVRAPFWLGILLGLATAALFTQVEEPERLSHESVPVAALLRVGRLPAVLSVSLIALLNQYIAWGTAHSFVPIYAADINASTAQLGMLMSAFQACFTLTSLGVGYISGWLGIRWSVVLGMGLTSLAILLTPMVSEVTPLLLLRILHGVGHGIAFPTLMGGAILSVSESKRGAAMGFFQAIYAIGMVAGPYVNGLFADYLGLGPMFYITGVLSVATTIAAAITLSHRIRPAD